VRTLLFSLLLLLALSAAAGLLVGGTAGTALAVFLAGSAAVLAVSAAFYAIGRAEDRERERGDGG
jgi:hypothetical protein